MLVSHSNAGIFETRPNKRRIKYTLKSIWIVKVEERLRLTPKKANDLFLIFNTPKLNEFGESNVAPTLFI